MLLYLLRHGDAVQSSSFGDSERPLSDFGKQQAASVGNFLRSAAISIDRIISSPLIRAVETSAIVGDLINVRTTEQTEYLVPGTRKAQLLDLLNTNPPKSALLVGHEPHLSQTLSLLLTEKEDMHVEFKKCALACLLASDPVRKGHAALLWFMTPDHMQLLHR